MRAKSRQEITFAQRNRKHSMIVMAIEQATNIIISYTKIISDYEVFIMC